MAIIHSSADADSISRMLASDDEKSFEIFYKQFYNRIYLFLLRKVRQKEIALQLTNDTFYKIYLNKEKIDSTSNVMGYFYMIAHNELRQLLRKKREILVDDDVLEYITDNKTIDEYEQFDDSWEVKTVLGQAIKELNSEEQTLLRLRFYEEKSLQEISDMTLMPLGTIKSKVSRLINKLRILIATKKMLMVYK